MACTRLIPAVSAARMEMKGSGARVWRRVLPGAKATAVAAAAERRVV